MLWGKNMWKAYDGKFIWEKALTILAGAIILGAWILLISWVSEWVAHAFRGMFL